MEDMKDMTVLKLNISPEEAEEFKESLVNLLKEGEPMILNSLADEEFDHETFGAYEEGYDDGFASAVEIFGILHRMTDKQLEDLFGSSDVIEIISDPDFESNFDSIFLNHIFDPGEILIEKKTGMKYMCVRDPENDDVEEFSFDIVVTDHHFDTSSRSRFDFAHFIN